MSEETQENPGEEPSMEDILASIRRILSEDGEEESTPEAAAPAPAAKPEEEMDMAAAMAAGEPEEEMDMAAAMESMESGEAEESAEPEEEMDMAAAMEAMEAEEPAPMQVELAEDDEPEAPVAAAPAAAPIAAPAPAPAPKPTVASAPPPPPARPGGEPDISSILDLTRDMITSVPEGAEGLVSTATYRASTDVLGDLARAILSQRELQVGGSDITLEGMVREMMRPLLKEWLDQNLPYLIERLVKKEIDRMINRAERLDS